MNKSALLAISFSIALFALMLVFFGCADVKPIKNNSTNGTYIEPAGPGVVRAYYFYQTNCVHCQKVEPLMDAMDKKYGKELEIMRLEISSNSSNLELLGKFWDVYDVGGGPGTPAIFIGDKHIEGDLTIQSGFESEITECIKNKCPDPILKLNAKNSTG